jgi:hypothetical protein
MPGDGAADASRPPVIAALRGVGAWRVCALALVALALASTAYAAVPDGCVEVEERDGDRVGIYNLCDQPVVLRACVDNPRSSSSCSRRDLGLFQLQPQAVTYLPSYRTQGRGTVWFAACYAPQAPQNWKGATSDYQCRTPGGRVPPGPAGKPPTAPRPPAPPTVIAAPAKSGGFPCDIRVQEFLDHAPLRRYTVRVSDTAELDRRWHDLQEGAARKRFSGGFRAGNYAKILSNTCGR